MTPRARVVIANALAADARVVVQTTTHRGHATGLAAAAQQGGADVVVVLGGDGTLNEVAGALSGTEVRVGVLPGGSTNVFARSLGMSDDPVEATGQLLDSLADMAANEQHVSLGSVNGRPFVFHTGIGFDAAVVKEVEKRGHLKRWVSHPLFVWSAFRTWAGYDRDARFDVTVAGLPGGQSPFALVLNRDPYTYLGERPVRVASGADFDAGLVVVCFRSLGFVSTLGAAARALMASGGLRSGGTVRIEQDIKALTVESGTPFGYQVDGDYIGEARRLEIEHLPSALWVLRPANPIGAGLAKA